MKSSGFAGIRQVFTFTFAQAVKKKGYCIVTPLVALLLFAGIIVVQCALDYDALNEKLTGKTVQSSVEKIYINNCTEFSTMDFSLLKETADEKYEKLLIEETDMTKEQFSSKKEKESVLAVMERKEKSLQIMLYYLDDGNVVKDDVDELSGMLEQILEQSKIMESGISPEILSLVLAPVQTQVAKAGEEAEKWQMMIAKMILPMLAGFLIYFLILIYGQSISKEIVAEKTSKLMDTLLLLVEPYGIIGGKVIAMILVALSQVVIWICSLILGFMAGEAMLSNLLPKEEHTLYMMLKNFKDIAEGAAFNISGVILAVVSLILGFAMYCILAGLVSSKVSKAEDLAQSMGIFQMVVVVGFLASYLIPLAQSETGKMVAKVLRYIPVTAAYMLPADVLIGNISIPGCIISLCLILAVCVLAVLWMGKIYKDSVFYASASKKTSH